MIKTENATMKFFSNDLFRSLALGFLLGTVGMVAASVSEPAEASAVSAVSINSVPQ